MKIKALAVGILLSCFSGAEVSYRARASENYQADPVHSTVIFRVKHANTAFFWGRFNDITGAFALDSADPSQVKLQFQVKADSVDTGNAKRDQHVKGPDFLNAVQFPTITFASKSAQKSDNSYLVKGDMTMHGVTRPITVRMTPTGTGKGPTGAEIGGVEANVTIRQSEFGITKMAGMIGDSVWINISVEGVRN
jgi:polyisoprenoid-binding protein YceI